MFKKLRNKFIITNMVITTVILVLAFSAVFVSAAMGRQDRPLERQKFAWESQEIRDAFDREIEAETTRQLVNLAVTLVVVGLCTEFLVFGASYYIAQKSVEPVEDAYRKQQEFIANASHELKTPIAAAQANFEALGTTEQPWTANVEMELDRASRLVKDMLALTRAETALALPEAAREVDVAKVVEERVTIIEPRLAGKRLVQNMPADGLTTKVNEADFIQIVDILLDNAVKYADKRIVVSLREGSLTVKNDGEGVPEDKLALIFDRFYQTDKTAEGAGLGLAIAKSVAERNGWKLTAESRVGGDTDIGDVADEARANKARAEGETNDRKIQTGGETKFNLKF